MASGRKLGSMVLGVACLAVAGAVSWSVFSKRADSHAGTMPGETTASLGQASRAIGKSSGLPVPRFVSLKAEKVNVRRGPSSDHPVAWVFNRKGMPVEIVAESDNWRRIRDSDGEEGWILQNMLASKRTAVVSPWRQGKNLTLRSEASAVGPAVALLASGVVAEVGRCTGEWCEISAQGYDGWIEQSMLWGVYPGETVD